VLSSIVQISAFYSQWRFARLLWSRTGSEVMSRIAAPMVGGMISSTVLTLAVHGAEGADPIADVY